MTNVPFGGLEDFRDVESINAYHELTANHTFTPQRMLECLRYKSRDNARTPMQWDSSAGAGFTTGTPWIMVNPNYTSLNAAEQLARPDSVFHFYQALIRLRHTHEIIVYGSYDLLLPDDPQVYAYTRTLNGQKLLCVCNLTGRPRILCPARRLCGGQAAHFGGERPQPGRSGYPGSLGRLCPAARQR